MITHASATLPWRRSFSVHVEMYSRGSNSRGRRWSFPTCWSRMARRRRSGRGKTFAGSAPFAHRGQAHDRAERDEDEGEEPEAEREVRRNRYSRGVGEDPGQVHEELVQHEQNDAKPHEADSAPGAPVAMRDRARRVGGRVGERFRDLGGRRGGDRCGLGLWEVRGSIPSAGVTPPSFVLPDPTQGRAAVRAGVFRLADRRVRATVIAVPPAVSGDVREFAATRRARMEGPRRLDRGSGGNVGLRFRDRDEYGRVNPFHDGFLQGPCFDDLRGDRRRGGGSSCRFLLDGLRFDDLSRSRPGFPLDLASGLGRSRFGTRFRFLDALLHLGLAFERVEITQQSLPELLFRPCRIEILRYAQVYEGGLLGLKDLQTNDWRSRSRLRLPVFRRLLFPDFFCVR